MRWLLASRSSMPGTSVPPVRVTVIMTLSFAGAVRVQGSSNAASVICPSTGVSYVTVFPPCAVIRCVVIAAPASRTTTSVDMKPNRIRADAYRFNFASRNRYLDKLILLHPLGAARFHDQRSSWLYRKLKVAMEKPIQPPQVFIALPHKAIYLIEVRD